MSGRTVSPPVIAMNTSVNDRRFVWNGERTAYVPPPCGEGGRQAGRGLCRGRFFLSTKISPTPSTPYPDPLPRPSPPPRTHPIITPVIGWETGFANRHSPPRVFGPRLPVMAVERGGTGTDNSQKAAATGRGRQNHLPPTYSTPPASSQNKTAPGKTSGAAKTACVQMAINMAGRPRSRRLRLRAPGNAGR